MSAASENRARKRRRLAPASVAMTLALAVSGGVLGTTSQSDPTTVDGLDLVASSCAPAGGARVPEAAIPTKGDFAILGHGWGHGMGMSQYGAQGAARLGCSYSTILTTYYRGSRIAAKSMPAPVVLSLLKHSSRSTLQTVQGNATWVYGSRRVVQTQGRTWQVRRVGKNAGGPAGVALLDELGRTRLRVPVGARLTAAHTGSVVRLRSFLGSRTSASSDLTTRYDQVRIDVGTSDNTVTEAIVASGGISGVEKYLWALAEIPASWPREALKAQVVAARSYLATKYDSSLKAYRLSTTTSDQVYGGYKRESSDARMGYPWRKAVDATRGQVLLTSSGSIVTTMYSSSMGGYTEDRAYVYGSYGISYLKAVDDSRWDLASDNPYRSWAVGISKASLASKLGLSSVSSFTVAPRGSSARTDGAVVRGVKSGKAVTLQLSGSKLRSKLGLRSPGFTIRAIGGTTTPPPTPTPTTPTPSPTTSALYAPQPLVGDFDGDRVDDVGWYRRGQVSIRTARGTVVRFSLLKVPVGKAVVGDWNGDGRASVGVFLNGVWYLRDLSSTGPAQRVARFGRAGDVPVTGRWFGPSKAWGLGVVRGTQWFLRSTATSGVAQTSFRWSPAGAVPLAGDWDGDGLAQPGQQRGTTWSLARRFASPGPVLSAPWVSVRAAAGRTGDKGLVGSWRGQTRESVVVVRGCAFYFLPPTVSGPALGGVRFCG